MMRRSRDRSTAAALGAFVVVVVVALPVLVLGLGDHRWFHGDEWVYIFDRDLRSVNDIFRPGNAHWSTVPVVIYKSIYAVFGLGSYRPYLIAVVLEHLGVASLIRILMRRSGVNPWIATAACTAFVFFGAGSLNIIWGFQVGFNAALMFGFLQLLASDHGGPITRRDVFGLGAGLLSIMSAGIGVAAVATVGLATLLRGRGLRVAAFHTVPLALIYLVWSAITHPDASSGFGNPTPWFVVRWVTNGEVGLFSGLGGYAVVGALLAIVVVAGTAIVVWRRPATMRPGLPLAMAAGGVLFLVAACFGRWIFGVDTASSSRFLYVVAAFTLPAIALAVSAAARRAGPAGIALGILLLVVGIVPGHRDFGAAPFDEAYYDDHERILRTITRVPEATMVPPDVRPIPDPQRGRFLEIGNLRAAVRAGKLPETTTPLTTEVREEMKVRLGFAGDPESLPGPDTEPCPEFDEPLTVETERGDDFRITSRVRVSTVGPDGKSLFPGVNFRDAAGTDYTVELGGLTLRFAKAPFTQSFQVCVPG